MTNNENKTAETIDKEKAIEIIAGRIDDEFKKHHQLNWQKIAASKIHSQWFQQSQSALGEKDFIIKKKDEIIESQKQTFDSLLKKYEAKDKEVGDLKDEIENDRLSAVVDAKTIVRLEERIKELEEFINDEIINFTKSPKSTKDIRKTALSLLSQSKEQKEREGE